MYTFNATDCTGAYSAMTTVNTTCASGFFAGSNQPCNYDEQCYFGAISDDDNVPLAPTAMPTVGPLDGYFYKQYYKYGECSSDITYTQGYALDECLVAYSDAGVEVGSVKINCSSKFYKHSAVRIPIDATL